MYDKIKEDIAKNGIKVPLIVNQNYELINGYTRLKIAKELGVKKVPVAVYETTDRADEYDLLVSTNLTQRQLTDFLPALKGEGSPHRFGITSLI